MFPKNVTRDCAFKVHGVAHSLVISKPEYLAEYLDKLETAKFYLDGAIRRAEEYKRQCQEE